MFLSTCKEGTDYRNSFIFDESSNVIEHEDDDGIIFLLGLRKSAAMGRLLLFQDNTRSVVDNDTLTWNLQYANTVSQSDAPSILESATPSTLPREIIVSSPTSRGLQIRRLLNIHLFLLQSGIANVFSCSRNRTKFCTFLRSNN